MYTAYWNEPLPLKKQYPGRTSTYAVTIVYAIWSLLVITGLTVMLGADYPESPEKNVLFILYITLSMLFFWSAEPIGKLHRDMLWKNAFITNNADLKLDYDAVKKVIHLLRTTTSYSDVSFEDVVISLACNLRLADPFASDKHTTFSWEVLHAYHHFAFGTKEIQPTRSPRRT